MLKKNTGYFYNFKLIVLILTVWLPISCLLGGENNVSDLTAFILYIGSYSNSNGEGIYIAKMNRETGALELLKSMQAVNPSFLILHPNKKNLYAVNETQDFEGQPGGAVSAYSVDQLTGDLTLLNRQPTHGGSPCHVMVDKSGQYVVVANYGGGNVTVLPRQNDGSLGPATDIVQHTGNSINIQRQEAPHAHAVNLNPTSNYVYAVDLGIDKVMIYKLDTISGKLLTNEPAFFKAAAGSGPRHLAFHPNSTYAFIINELNSTITSCACDTLTGALTEIHTVPTIPQDFKGGNSCAEVQVSPDGRFVYGSNRGHDSIAIFAFDENSGHLSLSGFESTRGRAPRYFTIDPTGEFLLAANSNSNNINVFRINKEKGTLQFTGHQVNVSTPVCIQFLY
ncbi:MAG TPA: lactonase family protein [bacterium]|mgnify:CR=1 FL=1|nr:lactonase family protein [bacterium]HPN44709.1 lactonase family protein [bacterium]